MTIENLKQIAIKYATTKGSRVPLAPDELCNAVVQYFNEFLKITADINTIQVAVTEEGGNIVFTITGNTLDGKAFTPIVITVDHNDFVTNQEFEEFKTSVTEQLNNKRSVISSPASSYVVYTQANGLESNLPYSELANQTSTNIMARRANGTSDVKKGISGENVANMENIADLEEKIPSTDNFLLKNDVNIINYSKFKIIDGIGSNIIGKSDASNNMSIGSGNYAMQLNSSIRPIIYTPDATYNVAYTSDIPEYTNVDSVSYDSTNGAIVAYDGANEIHIPLLAGENVTIDASEDNKKIVISAAGGGGTGDVTASGNNTFTGVNMFNGQILGFGPDTPFGSNNGNNTVLISNDTTNGYIIKISSGNNYISIVNQYIEIKYDTYYMQLTPIGINFSNTENNANNIIKFSPVQSQGDLTLNMPSKTGEHTLATTDDIPDTSSFVKLADDNTFTGNNTFTGENTFNNSIYAKNGIVAGDTTNYGANSVTKGSNTYSFPNKSGTFAMTNDIINEPIYFISFYANAPSEPCHLIGTMMSKNSYGTGQKTNEEFAVILADNLYTNSNEGLAAYGRLANKDILCIYSEDGLSIRCLDEGNSEVDLPTVMFFVMETEL